MIKCRINNHWLKNNNLQLYKNTSWYTNYKYARIDSFNLFFFSRVVDSLRMCLWVLFWRERDGREEVCELILLFKPLSFPPFSSKIKTYKQFIISDYYFTSQSAILAFKAVIENDGHWLLSITLSGLIIPINFHIFNLKFGTSHFARFLYKICLYMKHFPNLKETHILRLTDQADDM